MSASLHELASAPQDAISSLSFSPRTPNFLIASSWDNSVRFYDISKADFVSGPGSNPERVKFDHKAPVLDCCWGDSDTEIFSGSLDWQVRQLNPETGTEAVLGQHENTVKSVCWNPDFKTLCTGSWDSTVRTFDPRASTSHTGTYNQPHKIFAMSTIQDKLVVAHAARSVFIYDLRNMSEPLQQRESSLKFMTRTVRCMPNGEGYASSSVEGRVAVEFFDASKESQARKYAFKCHRQVENGVDVVYPVNALAFHPIYGTFASGGGDGVVSLWDGIAKRRLRQYPRLGASVSACGFSCDGKYLGVAISSGFEDGKEDPPTPENTKIYVRELAEGEGRGKGQQAAAANSAVGTS
ncbi:WD40-repeat-containing domain protein [Kalaharituber pfeilii]|nr:WD40-repeat-containing domain protein [Kalaharituber pfeilii]